MKYSETMWAEQSPDVYAGDNCDEHEPRWMGSVEKEGLCAVGDADGCLRLDPKHFPAGTKVVVKLPCCPECGDPNESAGDDIDDPCDCGFSWKDWAGAVYS